MVEQAKVVVIGGGAVGCSVLYHLAKIGITDCILVERDELTSGSTWHAAGNCPNFSTNLNVTKLQRYSTKLYSEIGGEVDYPVNYHVTGSIRLAHTDERMNEFHHIAGVAKAQGIEFAVLTPGEAKALYPFMEPHDLRGVLYDPFDGDIDPSQLTQAFAKGARDLGCHIMRFTRVIALSQKRDGGWIVTTDKGDIDARIIVNAAGYRAGEVMAMLGKNLPIVTMEHQYLVTESVPALSTRGAKLPLLRDPDVSYYLRQEQFGFVLGPYEAQATPRWLGCIPDDFANQLFPHDLDRLESYIGDAMARVPLLADAGVRRVINGPIPYSPDGNPYIGPVRGVPNFFQACCFSFGIAQAGGAGKMVAEWISGGRPEWDIWSFDATRFSNYATRAYTVARARELYRKEYAVGFPIDEWLGGRPAQTTPLYATLKQKGAVFAARGGWERAAWFSKPGIALDEPPSFCRAAWQKAVADEVRAVQENVGILDMAGFTKLLVHGPGAAAWIDTLMCGRLPHTGRASLTWALDEDGRIVSEFTVTRRSADKFYLVSAAAAHQHDQMWLESHLPTDNSVLLTDVSGLFGTLVLAGPRARTLLAACTADDVSNAALPWMSAKEIEIGFARQWVCRIGYVGELSYELHMPIEALFATYQWLWDAGQSLGLKDFGIYAMDSMRIEKAYRGWKSDVTREQTPLAAGFERLVAFNKPHFRGREALLAERVKGPIERLVLLAMKNADDREAPPNSTVRLNGDRVGIVTSSAYGHRTATSLSLAYVRPDLVTTGTVLEVECCGMHRLGEVVPDAIYDPNNDRLKS